MTPVSCLSAGREPASGVVDSAAGLGPYAHLGWAYRSGAEFRARAGEYASDGLAAGQWVEYAGDGSREELRAELTELSAASGCPNVARAGASPLHELFAFAPGGDVVDPDGSIANVTAATEAALAAGYSGLRLVVDNTAVTRTPAQRDAFACFESLADRLMLSHPVTALCACDATVLGDAAAELVCLHPYIARGSTPFRCHAAPAADFALAGELDRSCAELLRAVLRRSDERALGATIWIEARELEFVDHGSLVALGEAAAARGTTIVLHGGPEILPRLLDILEVPNLRATGTEATGA